MLSLCIPVSGLLLCAPFMGLSPNTPQAPQAWFISLRFHPPGTPHPSLPPSTCSPHGPRSTAFMELSPASCSLFHKLLLCYLIWIANSPSWPNSINSCPGQKDLTLNSSPSLTRPVSQPSFILHKCFYFLSSKTEEGWAYMPPPPWYWVSLIGLQEAQAFFHHY